MVELKVWILILKSLAANDLMHSVCGFRLSKHLLTQVLSSQKLTNSGPLVNLSYHNSVKINLTQLVPP
jgi:hypothetical protein